MRLMRSSEARDGQASDEGNMPASASCRGTWPFIPVSLDGRAAVVFFTAETRRKFESARAGSLWHGLRTLRVGHRRGRFSQPVMTRICSVGAHGHVPFFFARIGSPCGAGIWSTFWRNAGEDARATLFDTAETRRSFAGW